MTTPDPSIHVPNDTFSLPRPKVVERIAFPADASGGALSVLEVVIQPGGLVAPVHVHTNEDETLYVIDGTVGALVGDTELEATVGATAFLPRGVAHSFWNASDQTAKLLVLITPGNLDGYFRGLPDQPGPEAIVTFAHSYGMELRMDSVAELGVSKNVTMF